MAIIYCLEDDENIRDLLVYALKNSGYKASAFENSKELYGEMSRALPDLLLLDIMLPGEDGLSVLRKLRSQASSKDLPIIMLTAKSSEFDKVMGLDSGADDYISKPFSVMELLSRVRAILRRSRTNIGSKNIKIGHISLDQSRRQIMVMNKTLSLTYKEFELLSYLMDNRDLVLTREDLLQAVWGFDYQGETRTVDVHVASLRQKLGRAGSQIKTIRNVGYKIGDL